ncbi:MAG: hypothetical protein JSV88_24945 [Candidatus Aminicenantes bacterium]|nr:MAG: hypothetical protein JSV88_24945 [Candidatus Aminicenantes bacterium]
MLLTVVFPLVALSDGKEAIFYYQIRITSRMTMKIQGLEQKLEADTTLRYTWKRSDQESTLIFDAAHVKAKKNGQELMNTFMSREKLRNISKGETEEVRLEDAAEDLKNMLQDSFGVPVCKLVVDKSGKEIKRTIVAGPGAKTLIENGMIANALLFHTRFPENQHEWQASSEVSMGNGGYARGKLTYLKQTNGKAGQTIVKVSGILLNDDFRQPGTKLTIKAARYVVSGNQTYDLALREWISGKLSFEVSFLMESNDKPLGSAEGMILVILETLPSRK